MEPQKFVLKSIAIIGTTVTFATAVLPPLSKMLGHEINPADIVAAGDSAKTAISALGGFAGIVLAYYGRFRASAPLSWSPK